MKRSAAAGFGAHVRKQRGYFGNAYEIARARAQARDAEIAARLAEKKVAS